LLHLRKSATHTHTCTERRRERDTHKHTDIPSQKISWYSDRQYLLHFRKSNTDTHTHTHRHTHRHTHIDTHRHTHTHTLRLVLPEDIVVLREAVFAPL